jgi:hypothetical protein
MKDYFFSVNNVSCTTSLFISEAFGKPHADLLKTIRKAGIANKSLHFIESEFTNSRNRKYPGYYIDAVGFSYLMIGSAFRSKPSICSMFSESLGAVAPLIIEAEIRHEERFYLLLKSAIDATQLDNKHITKQFAVGKYRVDFYIKSENLIIEYDEDQHLSKKNEQLDAVRMAVISDALSQTCDLTGVVSKPKVVRVKKGQEGKGIVDIITCLISGLIVGCVIDIQ